jgi:exonuclease III
VRIVTWNCCRGPLATKLAALETLLPDIAVLQECPRPATQSPQFLWFGDNPRHGVGVLAFGGFRLRRLPRRDGTPKHIAPVAVSGPMQFALLAVWAMPHQPYRYVEAVIRAVDLFRTRLARADTLLLGDLNSNAIWDAEHKPDRSHSALVRTLAGLGMQSCYHEFFREAHGAESTPTFHLYRQEARAYHLDYCFAPRRWVSALQSVTVGPFQTWAQHSDHRPIVLEFAHESKLVTRIDANDAQVLQASVDEA